MARTYTLNPDRKFVGTPCEPFDHPVTGLRPREPDEDQIPMGRVVGGELSWTHMEGGRPAGLRTGTVRQIRGGITLVESNGQWFTEDANGITEIEPAVCPTCCSFPCAPDCHTHPPQLQMNPTPFAQLASFAHKQLIPCVEGTIVSINDALAYGSGPNTGKKYQYATLRDAAGLSHDVKFDADNTVQDKANRGKLIRIESHQGAKGLSGVYYDINEYPAGKVNHRIRTTATAVITYPQAGNTPQSNSGASTPPPATQTPPDRQDAQNPTPHRNAGHSSGESTVGDRVGTWLQIAEEVCHQISKPFEAFMEGLSSTDIKEITTGISMSYKGQYGVYQAPVFGHNGNGGMAYDPPSSIPSWKNFINAKSGKKLGDYDEATFLKLSCWAYSVQLDPSHIEAVRLQANVRMGTVEKKIARHVFLSLFAQAPGYGTEFDEQDAETVAGEQYGKASSNLSVAEWEDLLNKFPEVIQDCKTAHSNNDPEIPF